MLKTLLITTILLLLPILTSANPRVRRLPNIGESSRLLCFIPGLAAQFCKNGSTTTPTPNTNPGGDVGNGNPDSWQSGGDKTDPARTVIGTGSGLDLGQLLGNSGLPSSNIGGGGQVAIDQSGANLGRNIDVLGVAGAKDGLGANVKDGNVGVSGGRGLDILGLGIGDNTGVNAGKDGVSLGRQANVGDFVSGGQSGGVNWSDPDKVSAGGGSALNILNGFISGGQQTGVDVNKHTGATNIGKNTGIAGIFNTGSNLGIDPMNGNFGGGKSTCVLGICGQSSSGVNIGPLANLFG